MKGSSRRSLDGSQKISFSSLVPRTAVVCACKILFVVREVVIVVFMSTLTTPPLTVLLLLLLLSWIVVLESYEFSHTRLDSDSKHIIIGI